MATFGTKEFGPYRGVATNQRSYKYYFNAVGTKTSSHCREVATHQARGGHLEGFHCTCILHVPIITQDTITGFSQRVKRRQPTLLSDLSFV